MCTAARFTALSTFRHFEPSSNLYFAVVSSLETQVQLVGLKTFVAGAFSPDPADCPWDSEDAVVVHSLHAAAELYFLNVAFTMVWRQNSREEVIHLFPKVQETLNWIENSGSPVGFFDTWTFVLQSVSWTVKGLEIGNFRVVSMRGLLKRKAFDMKMTFYSHAMQIKLIFALSIVLKVRVFGTQKHPIDCTNTDKLFILSPYGAFHG